MIALITACTPMCTLRSLWSQKALTICRFMWKTRYIDLNLYLTHIKSVFLSMLAYLFHQCHMCVLSAEQSDGGAVWGMSAANFWFGSEGDVSYPTAAGYTGCLCRCVWCVQLMFCSNLLLLSLFTTCVSHTAARLYLTGSSMNGLGCRSSDADLCLVLKGNVSIFDFASSSITVYV